MLDQLFFTLILSLFSFFFSFSFFFRIFKVDEFQNTTQAGVYALGDVCGKVLLTPMAIAAGRKLAHRLFEPRPNYKQSFVVLPRNDKLFINKKKGGQEVVQEIHRFAIRASMS
jgi:hypothetical protein